MTLISSNDRYRFVSTPYHIDRKLYKYYSNIDYAVDCIKNRRIHLDDPLSFNDPFDSAFSTFHLSSLKTTESETKLLATILLAIRSVPQHKQTSKHDAIIESFDELIDREQIALSTEKREQFMLEIIKKLYSLFSTKQFTLDEFIEEIDLGFVEYKRVMHVNCRISCFSEVKDSILMWSYYAQNHRGVCIEFDLEKLDKENELNQRILENMSRVYYSSLRADKLSPILESSGLNLLITKADVWQHEREWRLICEAEEEFLPFDCISGIYLGINFPSKRSADVIEATKTYEWLPIYHGKHSLDKYEINFDEDSLSYMRLFLAKNRKG